MIPAGIATRLARTVGGCSGRVSVSVRTDGGDRWAHDDDRVVPAASTIKIAVLLAALAGGMPFDAPVALPPPPDRVGGCGPLSLLPSVSALPAGELATLMVACSDNDATNAILERIGMPAVARLLDRAGTRHTELRRRMMDPAAIAAGTENATCATDLTELLARVRAGTLLDPAATRCAVEVLRRQQFTDGLAGFLGPDVAVGSKTGILPGLRHDVALLERGDRWVAVAVLVTGLIGADGVDRGSAVLPVFARIGEIAADLIR